MMFIGELEILKSKAMSLIIGSGARRAANMNQLLGIGNFDASRAYSAGKYIMHNGIIYRFTSAHAAGAEWDESIVRECSAGSVLVSILDPRFKPLSADTLKEGDVLFYDRAIGEYCIVAMGMLQDVLADYNQARYETHFDTYVGTFDGVAHFVARGDAAPTQDLYDNDRAATPCYYRIEIDNTQMGSIEFSATSGNASISNTTISWNAGDSMETIVAKFTAKSNTSKYITFAALADGTGVGLSIGGNGNNTLTVSGTPVACTVIDCSKFAFLRSKNPAAPAVGGIFDPTAAYTLHDSTKHHNFRGALASSVLSDMNLVGGSTVCIAMDGYNYSYRCGLNFAKFRDWAKENGETSFFDDGEDGQTGSEHISDPGAHVMTETTFKTNVAEYEGEDVQHKGMRDYYTHLFTDQAGEFAELRRKYEAMYGQMGSMYDAYLMSHMGDPAANSGITAMMRNKGKKQTEIKGDCMNVNYNYVIIPAYPPEYNALHYGIENSEGFAPGVYYHPEPGDLMLMFRDDIMRLVNVNIVASGGGTQLTNSLYRGSCADYSAINSWCFYGTNGVLSGRNRFSTYFRCRPSLALPLPN